MYQSSFIGYFPAQQPKYTIAVVIQNNISSKLIYGAEVSGVVFKQISDRIYQRYLGSKKFIQQAVNDSTAYKYVVTKRDIGIINRTMNFPMNDSAQNQGWRAMFVRNNAAILNSTPVNTGKNKTPDVRGMGVKDAVYVLQERGFSISINGKGRIINQSLLPGTMYAKGQKITLILN
jgi:cell division protein FtsI (penicillin-binding protein 3)